MLNKSLLAVLMSSTTQKFDTLLVRVSVTVGEGVASGDEEGEISRGYDEWGSSDISFGGTHSVLEGIDGVDAIDLYDRPEPSGLTLTMLSPEDFGVSKLKVVNETTGVEIILGISTTKINDSTFMVLGNSASRLYDEVAAWDECVIAVYK